MKKPKTNLKNLWPYIKPYKHLLVFWFISLVVSTVCMVSIPFMIKTLINDAMLMGSAEELKNAMFLMLGLAFILGIAVFVRSSSIGIMANGVIVDLRDKLFAHILKQDIAYFESNKTGEIIARLTSDLTVIRETLMNSFPLFVRGFFLFLGAVTCLLYINAKLTLILFSIAPIIIAIGFMLAKKWRKLSKQILEDFSKITSHIEETIYGISTVFAFNKQSFEAELMATKNNEMLNMMTTNKLSSAAFFAFNIVVGFSAIAMVLWLGGTDVIKGKLTIGDISAYMLFLAFLGDGFSSLATFAPVMQTAKAATERIFEMLHQKPTLTETANPQKLPQVKGGRNITFNNVNFAYPSNKKTVVLKNINLSIKNGETIAIVGPSGAGKSTLFHLLMRFYDPTSGSILIDGFDLKELTFSNLRNEVAIVAQETAIFSTTIQNNINYGKLNATGEEIIAAAKAAHADEFIKKLPETYHTHVGEKGVKLSGGQKQRLSIARTILTNPAILLLDEATSNLDAKSEKHVQKAFKQLMQHRTTLVIAHRLATVKEADKIVVMDKGEIIAVGTHAQLLKSCELYSHLAALQFIN